MQVVHLPSAVGLFRASPGTRRTTSSPPFAATGRAGPTTLLTRRLPAKHKLVLNLKDHVIVAKNKKDAKESSKGKNIGFSQQDVQRIFPSSISSQAARY
jgi:hypothetical protein